MMKTRSMTLKDENEKLKRLNGCLERESNHRFNRINTLVSKLNKLKDQNEKLKERNRILIFTMLKQIQNKEREREM